ncbi:MAG: [FeFe] hydrogenase, group A [Planctomycetota bacterium]|jgi:NADH-quinone oxidoreductase subunit G
MENKQTITINGREVPFNGQPNLLEVIRSANIEMPTFCYHSELSVYGACRLCIVDIEGMGVVTSCSTTPKAGMVVRTHTSQLRKMRKIYMELLLADHHQTCTTCAKNSMCKLQDLAGRLDVGDVRFKCAGVDKPLDTSSPSLIRNPNKCILCGDCVRACDEIQGIGAIDFANRGASTTVVPAFEKDLRDVDCVYCGLCASVCPTGAITPRPETEDVWNALHDENITVVVQIAPAVRVAIGEMFGAEPGTISTGKMVASLKMLGFDQVFDTSFSADLTVLEETNEFLQRKTKNENLPLFTSCCPAWVKYVEQSFADILPHVSSCRSPQQMFGSVARETLPKTMDVKPEDLYIVSIMPCTAKKFEAKRMEFAKDGLADVDAVITTQELGRMIKQAGIQFNQLTPESLDMPLGFKTGAGIIFGTTGGVSEAVLRYASEKLTGQKPKPDDIAQVRARDGVRVHTVKIGDTELKMAIVHGLKNARIVADQVRSGQCNYDFVEVMACPGGCVAGAGQPVSLNGDAKLLRTKGLYNKDKDLQLHNSDENPYLHKCYQQHLGEIGGHKAHDLLHTKYSSRKRFDDVGFVISEDHYEERLEVSVCVGTSCYLRGSQKLLEDIMKYVKDQNLHEQVEVRATFCFEACEQGPTVRVGETVLQKATAENICEEMNKQLQAAV